MNDTDARDEAPIRLEPEASRIPVIAGGRPIAGAGKPAGLALDFVDGAFVIEVWPEQPGEPVRLGPYADEDVIALWRQMAAASGLPLLLPGPDGVLQQPYPQLGRILLGTKSDRRRLAVLSGRRPRFLAKRRATALPRRPRIHRESEIFAGRAR